jgi:type VI secretion system protein VasD
VRAGEPAIDTVRGRDMIRRVCGAIALSLLGLSLVGCGSAPPKPSPVKAAISATADVNPNPEGRASPVHVRIFQLKEPGAFMDADYWALVDKEQATLGASLLQRQEQDLVPGEKKEFELKIDPEAHVLGVMAEFADYRNAVWRTIAQTPNKTLMDMVKLKKDRITIGIEKSRVVLTVGD